MTCNYHVVVNKLRFPLGDIPVRFVTLFHKENLNDGLDIFIGLTVQILAKTHPKGNLRFAIEIKEHPNLDREDGWPPPPA